MQLPHYWIAEGNPITQDGISIEMGRILGIKCSRTVWSVLQAFYDCHMVPVKFFFFLVFQVTMAGQNPTARLRLWMVRAVLGTMMRKVRLRRETAVPDAR